MSGRDTDRSMPANAPAPSGTHRAGKSDSASIIRFPVADFPKLFDALNFSCLEPVAASLLQMGMKGQDAHAVEQLILRDPILVAKILARGQRCDGKTGRTCVASIKDALGYLGSPELTRLLEREPLTPPGESPFHKHAFMLKSIGGALIAQHLAALLDVRDPHLLTAAAILRDIGKPLQELLCAGYSTTLAASCPMGVNPLASEREIVGIDHVTLSALALKRWGLPELLIEVVRQHHEIASVSSPRDRVASLIVHAADSILQSLAPTDDPFDYIDNISEPFLHLLDEVNRDLSELVNECREIIRKLRVELQETLNVPVPAAAKIPGLPSRLGYFCVKATPIDSVRNFATTRVRLVMNFPIQQIGVVAKGGSPCLINLTTGASSSQQELLDKLAGEGWRGGLFVVSQKDHATHEQKIQAMGGAILVTPFRTRHFDELLAKTASIKSQAA